MPTIDEMVVDGHGKTYSRHSNRRSAFLGTEQLAESHFAGERLTSTMGVARPEGRGNPNGNGPAVQAMDSIALAYDASGNVIDQRSIRREWIPNITGSDEFRRAQTGSTWSWFFYDAEERLRYSQVSSLNPGPPSQIPVAMQQEYWYDALGRRILVRTRVDSATCGAGQVTANPHACQQAVARTVWDGDQIVKEYRALGDGRWRSTNLTAPVRVPSTARCVRRRRGPWMCPCSSGGMISIHVSCTGIGGGASAVQRWLRRNWSIRPRRGWQR